MPDPLIETSLKAPRNDPTTPWQCYVIHNWPPAVSFIPIISRRMVWGLREVRLSANQTGWRSRPSYSPDIMICSWFQVLHFDFCGISLIEYCVLTLLLVFILQLELYLVFPEQWVGYYRRRYIDSGAPRLHRNLKRKRSHSIIQVTPKPNIWKAMKWNLHLFNDHVNSQMDIQVHVICSYSQVIIISCHPFPSKR